MGSADPRSGAGRCGAGTGGSRTRCGRLPGALLGGLSPGSDRQSHGRSFWPPDQREALGVIDGLDVQVDVEVGPTEIILVIVLDVQDLRDGRVLEPWESRKRHDSLAPVDDDT